MTRPPAPWVLVIEDNTMNADILRENLLDAGFEFALAVNGAAGVAVANELFPDIILMDVNLPLLDGLSATRLLKKNANTQPIPVLALTAKAMAGDRETCLAAGCDDYVSKPIDMDVLLAKINHHLARRPAAFVEMIRRQREESGVGTRVVVELSSSTADPRVTGRPQGELAEQVAELQQALERREGELRAAADQLRRADDSLSERALQLEAVVRERDTARSQAQQAASRLTAVSSERDRLRAELDRAAIDNDALRAERAARSAAADVARALPSEPPVATETDERWRRRLRKLQSELDASLERAAALQRQIDGLPADVRTLHQQHERLRKAFLQLHRNVVKSAEDAMHEVAFGT